MYDYWCQPSLTIVWFGGLDRALLPKPCAAASGSVHTPKGSYIKKAWLFDDALAMVGTTNLDNRSLHLNFEIMVGLLHEQDIAALRELLLQDWSACNEYDASWASSRPLWRRLLYRMACLAAPLL